MKLTRYWLEFEEPANSTFLRSFGITAWTYDDALTMLKNAVSDFYPSLLTKSITHVDVRTLDPDHVLPNMGDCSVSGIWFPKGYQ